MSKKPVDYDELFPGRFLKAGLFKGKSVTLTIKDVEIEKLPQDNGKERDRGVISFNETPMQLALNSTNGQCLKAMFGRKPLEWVGKKVTFVPEKDRFGKEVVDAIRVSGSPDIKDPIDVEIRMPRKKPKNRRLVPTVKNGASATSPEQEALPPPADDYEPEPDLSQIQ